MHLIDEPSELWYSLTLAKMATMDPRIKISYEVQNNEFELIYINEKYTAFIQTVLFKDYEGAPGPVIKTWSRNGGSKNPPTSLYNLNPHRGRRLGIPAILRPRKR